MAVEPLNYQTPPPGRTNLIGWVVGVLVGGVLTLFVFAGAASFLPVWVLILATIALGVVVFVKSQKVEQRQWWIDQGCCADCGFDLRRMEATVCPECGRDATLDEPVWRRLRREHEAKYGRGTLHAGGGAALSEAEVGRLLAEARSRATDATG